VGKDGEDDIGRVIVVGDGLRAAASKTAKIGGEEREPLRDSLWRRDRNDACRPDSAATGATDRGTITINAGQRQQFGLQIREQQLLGSASSIIVIKPRHVPRRARRSCQSHERACRSIDLVFPSARREAFEFVEVRVVPVSAHKIYVAGLNLGKSARTSFDPVTLSAYTV
jgi:hypothetical protein